MMSDVGRKNRLFSQTMVVMRMNMKSTGRVSLFPPSPMFLNSSRCAKWNGLKPMEANGREKLMEIEVGKEIKSAGLP